MIICFVLYASLHFVESEGFPVSRYKTYGIFRFHEGMPICRFHELSHTNASLLIAQGVDVRTVAFPGQYDAGHLRPCVRQEEAGSAGEAGAGDGAVSR